ncbi:MAG: universal stress protein [Planctomycetota bacterium]
MSRILVAVSSPLASRRLGEAVADLAHRLSAEVLVVHVSRPTGQSDNTSAGEKAEESIRTLADHIRVRDVAVQTLLLFADDVPRAILNTARDGNCTLIALGLSGRGMLSRLIAGNVPVELLRSTDLPVIMFPADAPKV